METRFVPLADQIAERIASTILAGRLQPDQRLDEVAWGEELDVSRNTLREAFRLLAHQGLVEHRPNRGVFVRHVEADEARDLFVVRRQLELGALDELVLRAVDGQFSLPRHGLDALRRAVEMAERTRAADDWNAVGTANSLFHLGVVDLADNSVASRLMRPVIAQTRLRYLTVGNPRRIHEPFVDQNRRILDLLVSGFVARARGALEVYLLQAEGLLG